MVPAAHQREQAGAELASWHGVERGVDGLVAEPDGIGHTSQCARDLRWTQALAKVLGYGDPKLAAGHKPAGHSRSVGQPARPPIGRNASIASGDPGPASLSQLGRG
jgi:hypothetical protein